MKNLISNVWARALWLLLLNFVFAVSIVRNISGSYNYYLSNSFMSFLNFPLSFSATGFVITGLLTILSLSWTKNEEMMSFLANVDSGLILFLVFFVPIFSYSAVIQGSYSDIAQGSSVLLFSFLAYFGALTFAYAYYGQIKRKCIQHDWKKFFEHNSMKSPIGLLMAFLLLIELYYFGLFVLNLLWMGGNEGTSIIPFTEVPINDSAVALFFAMLMVILTYIVHFIQGLSADYEEANQEKIRSERFKAELITSVSHDMKTPLTSIINYVDLLEKLPIEDEKFNEYTEVLERKSLRLKTLMTDLLDASKAGTGNISVKLQPVNLTEFVGQIIGEFDEDFTARGLTLVYQQPDHEIIVAADVEHLWRVLENIFGNALKYSLENSRVFARVLAEGNQVSLQLVNTSQEPIELTGEALTEQFIRGDKARHTEGSGLGLYIAKSLIELMNAEFVILVNGDLFEVQLNFFTSQ